MSSAAASNVTCTGMPIRTSVGSTPTRFDSDADAFVEVDEHRDHRDT